MAVYFNKRTWVDRDVENPNGRIIVNDSTGVATPVTVQMNEGEVYVEGDTLTASNANDLEDRIEAAFNSIPASTNVSVTPIVTQGTDIATITVDGTPTTIKAPAQVSEIDDTSTASNKTWSANKLNGLLILDVTNVGV